MGNRWRLRRPRLWPPSYLKYLLIWPLVRAYRRKVRTSLGWRLAGSHFGTVVLSVLAIFLVGMTVLVIAARFRLPSAAEAAVEAKDMSNAIEAVTATTPMTNDELSAVLKAAATGQIAYNENQREVNIQANAGQIFKHIHSISLVDRNGVVIASSNPELISETASTIDQRAGEVVARALVGTVGNDIDALSGKRLDGEGLVGAYPVRDANGAIIGAILVDKSKKALPEGFDLLLLVLSFMTQAGTLLLVLVGVPAIPIGILVGIRRARAISRPVSELAEVAESFAAGNLDTRVRTIRGKDEIAELQHSFNDMADLVQRSMTTEAQERERAEQALIANRDLIANVSHELRTPVALIRGHLEALDADPESKDAYVRIALREADRLEHLVNDLFQLSRLEAHRLELDLTQFDAGLAVRSAVESLVEPSRREAGLTITAQIESGALLCMGDRLRFEQVLLNLIRNAIHFTPEGGIILVSARAKDASNVLVTVGDTGIGIEPEHLPHLFDRFYRAEQSRARASGGAGLGLAIAKELVEAMGGTITVESVPDEGTTFSITLPRAERAERSGNSVAPVAARVKL